MLRYAVPSPQTPDLIVLELLFTGQMASGHLSVPTAVSVQSGLRGCDRCVRSEWSDEYACLDGRSTNYLQAEENMYALFSWEAESARPDTARFKNMGWIFHDWGERGKSGSDQ